VLFIEMVSFKVTQDTAGESSEKSEEIEAAVGLLIEELKFTLPLLSEAAHGTTDRF